MKFDKVNHKEMWLWLSRHPNEPKSAWPKWEDNGGTVVKPENMCFACSATPLDDDYDYDAKFLNCEHCVLVWGNDRRKTCNDAEFGEWKLEEDLKKKSELALRIANLPLRKEFKKPK